MDWAPGPGELKIIKESGPAEKKEGKGHRENRQRVRSCPQHNAADAGCEERVKEPGQRVLSEASRMIHTFFGSLVSLRI